MNPDSLNPDPDQAFQVNPDPTSHKNSFVCSFVGPFILHDRDSKNGSEYTDPHKPGYESNLYKVSDTPKMISKGTNEFTGFLK